MSQCVPYGTSSVNPDGSCECSQGFYNVTCNALWIDVNPTGWYVTLYLLLALGCVLVALAVVCIVLHLWFRRMFSREVLALLFVAFGGSCIIVTLAVDPYGFKAALSGVPTSLASSIVLDVVNLLGYASIACSYGILTFVWLTLRATRVSFPVVFVCGSFIFLTIVLAIVCPLLRLIPISYNRTIFYIYLAVVALAVGITIVFTGLATLCQLRRLSAERAGMLRRIVVHVVVVGALLVGCVCIFVVVAFFQTDSSFAGFLLARLIVPGLLTLALQYAVLSTFRFRRRAWDSVAQNQSSGPAKLRLKDSLSLDENLAVSWQKNTFPL